MNTIKYELADGIATITFDEEGSPVNTMCQQWQHDLVDVTAQVVKDKDAIKGILLASNKNTFFAGADLKATMRLQPTDGPRVFAEIEQTKKCFRTLETLGKPVVSCLNGTALGGGWEVALVGHYRVAVDNPKIQFGLPEITLGLIPGASGITKMTRLLGLMGAQPFILESKLFSPREALELGLVHELVPDVQALRPAALAYIAGHPEAHHPWDDKNYKMPGGTPANPKIAGMLAVAPAVLKQKTRGLYPAPEAALAAMVEGAQVDFDTALRIESRYLARLIVSPVAKNMINTFFFDMNAIRSGQSRPPRAEKYKPQKIGIIGAGMMGAGIAYVQASRGVATVLRDVSIDKAQAGKAYSERITRPRVDKGRMSAFDQTALLSRITPTDNAADLQGCDLIIEAVFENRELKARVTQEAQPLLAPGGFFASNTSTLPITGLAKASRDPAKFVGIHFFSPVDKMKLVEIIRGKQTDDDTVARAFDYVQAIGKIPIVVNDSRGFFTSRVFGTFVMEGAAMVGEGIPAPVVEQAGIQAGMPVGPLAVLDETALSLSVHVLDQTRADLRAEGGTYIATPGELLVERMVKEFDRNGRAAGAGFYDYPEEKGAKKSLWPGLKALFEQPATAWDMQDLKDRLLYRQAVETARCLSENVLTSVHDANIGSIFGIGFPAWTGGAMQFIYGIGVEKFMARAEVLAGKYGPGFALTSKVKDAIHAHRPAVAAVNAAVPTAGLQALFEAQRQAFAGDPCPARAIRLDRLDRLRALLADNEDAIAQAISADFGQRSRHETAITETVMVLAALSHARKHLARWMKTRRVATSFHSLPGASRITPQPLGVVGIVSPWNYPLQLALAPAVAALAAGNRVLLKPSELTPGFSALLAKLVERHFAAEEFAVINGDADVGRQFVSLPFDHLFFTGSTAVGRQVAVAAASNLTPVTLELGGKSPVILDAGCDLVDAASRIAAGKLLNAGQTCIAPDYVLVASAQVQAFAEAFEQATRRMYPRLEHNPDYTSIVNNRHLDRLQALVEDARARGARVRAIDPGGEPASRELRKMRPTLLLDVTPAMAVMQEEIFGPVLPVLGYATLDEAIAFVNQRPRPLALYWFGKDRINRERVLRETISGGVTVNDVLLHVAQENLPFGGVGASGSGAYHGEAGFRTFSRDKPVFEQSRWSGTALLRPPYGARAARILRILKRLA